MSNTLFNIILLLFFCWTPFPGTGHAASLSAAQQFTALQKKYQQITSLSFDFTQHTSTRLRSRLGKGNGIFLRLKRSNNTTVMRWNYTEPDPQIILNDGRNLSIYTKNDRQLIVTSAMELNNDITYSFFSGKGNLTEEFIIEPPDNRYNFTLTGIPLHTLRLVPRKPHPRIKAVQLWFDDAFLIHHLILEDHFDSITRLTFTNIQINSIDADDKSLLHDILTLKVPKNTEIINQ